jgi:Protein of unknown function (DUF3048) N-terminal domain/Protein of unknown function (DUF3048) C-terminal domain
MTQPLRMGRRLIALAATGVLAVACSGGSSAPATPGATRMAVASTSPTASPVELPSPSDTPTPLPTPTDAPTASPLPAGMAYADLDGVLTSADLAHRLPLAISIGDNAVARPQSGFSSASIVYQSYEEYGQDRYLMVFQEGTASAIGGVRSARPYFARWVAEYDALFGHYGGDTKVLTKVIPSLNGTSLYDMDGLHNGACPYHRITTRVAPHNAYTSSAALIGCLGSMGYPTTFQGTDLRPFTSDTPAADRPKSQSVTIPYRTVSVGYQFDKAHDYYIRLLNGGKQIDAANNRQVIARDIVVLFQPVTNDYRDGTIQRIAIGNVGSGKAIVFEEGRAIVGTWVKTDDTDLTRFYDASGNEIPLVRGEIFIQSVPPGTAVTYK